MCPISVLVADDHAIVRKGLRYLLESEPDIVVVGEAPDGHEAIRLTQETAPDVLLLDISMPGKDGIEVIHELCEGESYTRVLVLSGHNDPYFIQEALDLGASGYLTKDEVPEVIVEAVRAVVKGEAGLVSIET